MRIFLHRLSFLHKRKGKCLASELAWVKFTTEYVVIEIHDSAWSHVLTATPRTISASKFVFSVSPSISRISMYIITAWIAASSSHLLNE